MKFPLLAILLALLPVAAQAADKRVYKIDRLVATQKHGKLTVQASGAVPTGGWKNARLHVLHVDAKAVTVEFIAAPPPPGMTVIEALVPVSATIQVKARGAVGSVRVVADANEMTAQVLH